MEPIITSFDVNRTSNAQLMLDVHRLGYLQDSDYTLDCTYGSGRFWKLWEPTDMLTSDLDPRSLANHHWDFTCLPLPDATLDATVLDGPYKLNGRTSKDGPANLDEGYGAHVPATWQERHGLIIKGIAECVRVTRKGGKIFVKCQDQVCLCRVRWQTRHFADAACFGYGGSPHRCELVDMLHVYGSRKQPRDGTPQQSQDHSRRNYSTLLVLEKI